VAAQQAVGLNYGIRTTPDVAFNADPNSGVAVYDSLGYGGQTGWFQLGGTSAAAPAWAGLVAIANQGLATGSKGPLSGTQAQTDLYSLPSSDFHDIATGNNGYAATPGYDLVTGLGSPQANLVIAGVLKANGVSEGPVTAQATASTATTTATQTSSTRFDLTSSTSSGTGSVAGSSSNLGTSTVSVGPVATNLLAASSSQSTGTLAIQALSTPATTTLTQPAVVQAVAVTQISIGPSAVSTSTVGQSLLQSSTYSWRSIAIEDTQSLAPSDEAPKAPAPIDARPATPVQESTPARGDDAPLAPDPGRVTEPPVDPAQPMEDPALDPFDLALAQVSLSMDARRLEFPVATPTDLQPAAEERPVVSLSAVAGTAVLAAAGYRLVLGRSDRIRRRWSELRFP
jgi:hypothetical protein